MKLAISGHTGRMGKEVTTLAKEQNIKILDLEKLKEADVVIDFSSPEFTYKILKQCAEAKVPIVIGTTAIDEKIFSEYKKQIPIFYSPNMSMGVFVLSEMIAKLSPIKDYEFVIEETHHKNKKDAPSGTAILLQRKLENHINKKVDCVSIREDDVFGVHKILIKGPEETLTLEHVALNRTVFARGALLCAKKLTKKSPGFYTMKDLMND